jgi:predicted enzyme related to lactoylglutathione lyase
MSCPRSNPIVHLELHTTDLGRARSFYADLLNWAGETVHTGSGSYHALDLGPSLGGGMVECGTPRSVWLPYVDVPEIGRATERAVELGASVMLGPREGPCGWRSVLSTAEGGELALWQRRGWPRP